jgi:diaminopimelate epimerase
MATLPFWKMESVGNDFPLVHLEDVEALALASLSSVDFELAKLAVTMSDRHFGVGGDGLLAVQPHESGMILRMFNPDGTEDFCGNGIRCAAKHAMEEGWVSASFVVRHLDREVTVRVMAESIESEIGAASYDPEKVPTTAPGEIFNGNIWAGMDAGMPISLYGSALTTGSTHVVIPTFALPDDDSFRSVSARIEVDARFPIRTSVIWSQEEETDALRIRIWERGVGETLGCGTGSSAAAADYLRRKGRGGSVVVRNPGGDLQVRMSRWDAPITIVGQARSLYRGEYRLPS